MYDIKPLEEEWKKYRRKKRRPYIVIAAFVLLAGAGLAALYYTKGIDQLFSKGTNSTSKTQHTSLVFIANKPLDRIEVAKPVHEESLKVSSEGISDEIVEDLPLANNKPIRKKPRVKMHIVTTEMPSAAKKAAKKENPHKKVHLNIKKVSASHAYKEVAARFRETQDPADSLFLARAYYKMGKYKKAEYWALQTNNVDSRNEESILLFAKAKVKRRHKNEAIRILSKYIQQTNSTEAKILLMKIKKGKV